MDKLVSYNNVKYIYSSKLIYQDQIWKKKFDACNEFLVVNRKNCCFTGPIDHSDSETESQINEDLSKVCACRVDAKKLSMFLSADQISHNRIVCSVVHKRLVILCLQTNENVQLQCFITGIVY